MFLAVNKENKIHFLRYGDWTIEEFNDPVSISQTMVTEIMDAIGKEELRKMISPNGEYMTINADAHRIGELSNSKNETILTFTEFEMDWLYMAPTVHRRWTAHIRLNPPLVRLVQNQ